MSYNSITYRLVELKLGTFISFQIISIIFHVFIIYHLIFNRILRQCLHNHVVLAILTMNFIFITTDFSITIHFLRFGFIEESRGYICIIWNFLNAWLSNLSTFLMLWASIERHILIFYHRRFLNTKYRRFIYHYLPLILIILITFICYVLRYAFTPSCTNREYFMYNKLFCGKPCDMNTSRILLSIDYAFHNIFFSILIFVFSLILLIRVFWGKRKRNQMIKWRQHWKMTSQLISISILYLIGTVPVGIHEIKDAWTVSSEQPKILEIEEEVFHYFFYLISLALPFVCLLSLPQVYAKLPLLNYFKLHLNRHCWTRRHRVGVIHIDVHTFINNTV